MLVNTIAACLVPEESEIGGAPLRSILPSTDGSVEPSVKVPPLTEKFGFLSASDGVPLNPITSASFEFFSSSLMIVSSAPLPIVKDALLVPSELIIEFPFILMEISCPLFRTFSNVSFVLFSVGTME